LSDDKTSSRNHKQLHVQATNLQGDNEHALHQASRFKNHRRQPTKIIIHRLRVDEIIEGVANLE